MKNKRIIEAFLALAAIAMLSTIALAGATGATLTIGGGQEMTIDLSDDNFATDYADYCVIENVDRVDDLGVRFEDSYGNQSWSLTDATQWYELSHCSSTFCPVIGEHTDYIDSRELGMRNVQEFSLSTMNTVGVGSGGDTTVRLRCVARDNVTDESWFEGVFGR